MSCIPCEIAAAELNAQKAKKDKVVAEARAAGVVAGERKMHIVARVANGSITHKTPAEIAAAPHKYELLDTILCIP